jgi:hypothetical protein
MWGGVILGTIILSCTVLITNRRAALYDLAVPFLMLVAFFAIVVFHSSPVSWQIDTAWQRLTAQAFAVLLPVFIVHFNHAAPSEDDPDMGHKVVR